jgi:hypothetical protein
VHYAGADADTTEAWSAAERPEKELKELVARTIQARQAGREPYRPKQPAS